MQGYEIIEALRKAVSEPPFAEEIERVRMIKGALEKGKTVKLEKMKYAEAKSILKKLSRLGLNLKVFEEDDWPKSYTLQLNREKKIA